MAKTDTKPGLPGITIPVVAPPGGATASDQPVNLGGLFPVVTGSGGLTSPKDAERGFANLALSNASLLAQIQAKLYFGGFYSGDYVPVPGLMHPEDLAAFRSAVSALSTFREPGDTGTPTTTLNDYLTSLATVGQQMGTSAAQRRQVNVVTHPNPAAVRAAVDNAYVNVLGRKATDAERAAFLRTFDAEVVRAQTLPDEMQQAQIDQTQMPGALQKAVGSPVPVASGGRRAADERADDLMLANAAPTLQSPEQPNPLTPWGQPGAGMPNFTADIRPQTGPSAGTVPINPPLTTSGTLPPEESPGPNPDVDTFLHAISGTESGGSSTAKNLFGYTDGTWNHFGGYLHARDAPPAVQWEKARQDVANKLAAYKGNWRAVAMSWFLPAAVGNPALANAVPKGNKVTPNQYADIIIKRMQGLLGKPTPETPAAPESPLAIPSGADALTPLRIDVTTPDLGAESVESARQRNPVEAGAHDAALAMDSILRLLGGQ